MSILTPHPRTAAVAILQENDGLSKIWFRCEVWWYHTYTNTHTMRYVYKCYFFPQVLKPSAQGCCTWKTQRDGMGREGGGIGNTCKSKADSCQCMAKTSTIL